MSGEPVKLEPIGRWGRYPTFQAKVGTLGSTCVLIRRQRAFSEGDVIRYCEEHHLKGMGKSCTPIWQPGRIWKIEGDCLFISRT
jgi:hypothetical protein